jgi:hypothetical protein
MGLISPANDPAVFISPIHEKEPKCESCTWARSVDLPGRTYFFMIPELATDQARDIIIWDVCSGQYASHQFGMILLLRLRDICGEQILKAFIKPI